MVLIYLISKKRFPIDYLRLDNLPSKQQQQQQQQQKW